MPSTITIHVTEGAEMEVTSICAPGMGQMLANKEARQAYLQAKFTGPIGVYSAALGDFEDIRVNEDTTLQLLITPSTTTTLHITWTEIEYMLSQALPIVKKLHIACSKPERLVRLFMLPEGGLARPGASHWDEDLWPKDTVASDRKYRESLREGLNVTTSVAPLEELAQGSKEEVKEWGLVGEEVLEGFGPETRFSTTKAFKLVGDREEVEVKEWKEMRTVEGEESMGGNALTEEAIARFIQETGWKPKSSTPSSIYSGDEELYYDGELWLTVS